MVHCLCLTLLSLDELSFFLLFDLLLSLSDFDLDFDLEQQMHQCAFDYHNLSPLIKLGSGFVGGLLSTTSSTSHVPQWVPNEHGYLVDANAAFENEDDDQSAFRAAVLAGGPSPPRRSRCATSSPTGWRSRWRAPSPWASEIRL
mgnify:CR=1 FL=1